MTRTVAALILCAGICTATAPVMAAEGGSGPFLLGSHDFMAGIVPPPGTYILTDFVWTSGTAPELLVGGVVTTRPSARAFITKLNATQVFKGGLLGGRLGLNVNIPWASARLETGVLVNGQEFGPFADSQKGFGDLVITPILGWDHGLWHTSASLSVYLPTGEFSPSIVRPRLGQIDILSISKNRLAVDPTVSLTRFDPKSGFELGTSLGITFSARNPATDYQTAPELHFEATVAQHLPNGLALGAMGYVYQQLGDDSGSGADNMRAELGIDSLKARVFGVGPIASYSFKAGSQPLSLKAKYFHEFGAKRRLQSNVVWLTLGANF